LIGAEIGRLGLNGPEVIEQEAGIAELDARDRRACGQRSAAGAGATTAVSTRSSMTMSQLSQVQCATASRSAEDLAQPRRRCGA